jgi:hypothetical protein
MFESDAERDSFKQGLVDNSGASGAGKIIIMQGQGFDNTPEVTSIPTNQNDKLFDSTIENILNKICFAHGINPSIMGIKVAGSLGNDAELEMSYSIFEKNVIMPLRDELTEIYDALLDIAGVKNSIVINDFQIISGGATSATEEPSLADKLGIGGTQTLVSILSDALLTKEQKVNAVMLLYNMPIEDAKKLVYGSEDAVAAAAAAPMAVDVLSTEPTQTNDAIKNMTGRQHQQLLRIIRQFGQGKINKEQAAVLLRTGLGLSESDINLMLNESE